MTYPTTLPAAQVLITIADAQPNPEAWLEQQLEAMGRAVLHLEAQAHLERGAAIALRLHRADQILDVIAELVRLAEKYD